MALPRWRQGEFKRAVGEHAFGASSTTNGIILWGEGFTGWASYEESGSWLLLGAAITRDGDGADGNAAMMAVRFWRATRIIRQTSHIMLPFALPALRYCPA